MKAATNILRHIYAPFSRSGWANLLLVVFVAGLVQFGSTKHTGTVTYPYTDVEQIYLYDSGSYVTNDYVHIAFTRSAIVPSSANFHIDYRQIASTNDNDWTSLVATTFAEFNCPTNITFAAATNFNFMCYTTWTPGPTVQTNGVWHTYWGLDRKLHTYLIPVRAAVRLNGQTIAPPKSKENEP